MELADIIRVLFFLWVAISIGVYVYRLYRRTVHHETRQDRAARRQAERDGVAPPDKAPTAPATGPDGDPPPKPVPFLKGMLAGPSASPPPEDHEEGSLVREVIREELAKKERAAAAAEAADAATPTSAPPEPAAGRSGLFAKPARPVAELVAGIDWPCDLAPLVVGDRLDPQRVLFVTTGHSPASVASGMADELERLGFRVDSVSDNEAVARKPEGDLRLTVHDDPTAFGYAGRTGVVVELTS